MRHTVKRYEPIALDYGCDGVLRYDYSDKVSLDDSSDKISLMMAVMGILLDKGSDYVPWKKWITFVVLCGQTALFLSCSTLLMDTGIVSTLSAFCYLRSFSIPFQPCTANP